MVPIFLNPGGFFELLMQKISKSNLDPRLGLIIAVAFFSLALALPRHIVIQTELQLMGDHIEYFVPFGLGIPSLRLLWGALQNRQLYTLQKRHYSGKKLYSPLQ